MDDCIFCKLANGEIPTQMVCQNDLAAAFHDANPAAPVHVLVVPKAHHANLLDGVSAQTLGAMVELVGEAARKTGIDQTGFRTIMNTGPDADQVVQHLHMHVLGGRFLGSSLIEGEAE